MSETDRLAGVTSWRFDENSNLRHLTDAENQSPYKPTAWTYDARNLKLTEALPGHNPTSQIGDADYDLKQFTYDLAGRVDVATDQKGNTVTNLYDLASRLLQRDYRLFNQTAISDSDTFTYGDAGRMASAESGRYNNTVAFVYDAAGRLTSESLTITFGQTTTYTVQSQYDAANRRTGITYPDGSVVARQYTARDQLAQIDYNSAMVATFAYDNGLRRTSRTLGDTPGTQTTWTYGRQDNLPTAINSGIAGASFTYTYDANKNKVTEGISSPMADYGFNSTTYDQADRLTAWNRTDGNLDQAWDLSLVGDWATFTENQVQELRTHSTVHEIATIDATSLVHDATGNLTRNASDTLDRYTWDFDNRLLAADVDQDGTPECAYRYDALGRRVSKTMPDGEGSATTVFVGTIQELEYSPHAMQVVAEYAADAAPASPARKFVYAEYIDEPVMMVDETALGSTGAGSEELFYYHQNSLYSVAAVTDATGAVVERYAYSAYGGPLFLDANGNLLNPQASAIDNPYLFTGRRLDEETGLYYYRARMYDTTLGRFVSRDPIGYEGDGANLYGYVGNQPVISTDPSGLRPFDELMPADPNGGGGGSVMSREECCAAAQANPDVMRGQKPNGMVICCDGRAVPCVFMDNYRGKYPLSSVLAEKIIEGCINEHEWHHVRETPAIDCGCGEVGRAHTAPELSKAESECHAFKAHMKCLDRMDSLKEACSDSACISDMFREWKRVAQEGKEWCKQAGEEWPWPEPGTGSSKGP